MDSSIHATSNDIDLKTLEEVRDPHLISRYPPLYQRKQNFTNVSDILKQSKTMQNSSNSYFSNISSQRPTVIPVKVKNQKLLPTSSVSSSEIPKRKKLKNFLKNLSNKESDDDYKNAIKRSISRPFPNHMQANHKSSVYLSNNVLAMKTSSAIKSDSQSKTKARSLQKYPSSNTIIIPPVGEKISNYEKYSSPTIHGSNFDLDKGVDFVKYDMMNLDANALSPVSDEDFDWRERLDSSKINQVLYCPPTSASDESNETYYSAENLNIEENYLVKPPTRERAFQQIVSPTYKIGSHKFHQRTLRPRVEQPYTTIDERWVHRRR